MPNSKSLHDEKFQKIEAILAELLNLELIHEQRLSEIESVMAQLYPKESHEWHVEQGNLDDDMDEEDEADLPGPPIFEIYRLVKEKQQFVDDYKEAFQFCILGTNFSLSGSVDEIIETIIENRNS